MLPKEGELNTVRTMKTYWTLASGVIMVVASAAAGGDHMGNSSRRSDHEHLLKVSVEVQSTRWRLGETGFVRVIIENTGGEVIDEDVTPALVLKAVTPGP